MPITSFKNVTKAVGKLGRVGAFGIGSAEAAIGLSIPFTPGYYASKEFQYSFTPNDYGTALIGGVVLGGALRKFLFGREVKIKANELLENITTTKNNLNALNEKHRKLNSEGSALEQETLETSFKVYADLQTFFKNLKLSENLLKQIAEGKIDVEQFNRLRTLLDSLDEQSHRITDGAEYARSLFVEKKRIIDDSNLKLQENLTRLRALLADPNTHPDLKEPIKTAIDNTERTIALNNEKISKFGKAAKRNNTNEKTESHDPDPKNNLSQEEFEKIATERNKDVQELNKDIAWYRQGGDIKPQKIINRLKKIFGDKFHKWVAPANQRAKKVLDLLANHRETLTVRELAKLLKKEEVGHDEVEKWLTGNLNDLKESPSVKDAPDDLNPSLGPEPDPNEGVRYGKDGQEIPDRKFTTTTTTKEAGDIVEEVTLSLEDAIEAGIGPVSKDNPRYKAWKEAKRLGKMDPDDLESLLNDVDVCRHKKGGE